LGLTFEVGLVDVVGFSLSTKLTASIIVDKKIVCEEGFSFFLSGKWKLGQP
jgi:hypothetical protein